METVPRSHVKEVMLQDASSLHFAFVSQGSGTLLVRESKNSRLEISIRNSRLVVDISRDGARRILDAEDADHVDDGEMHTLSLTRSANGTNLYLDGYQVFCSTSTLAWPEASEGETLINQLGDPRIEGLLDLPRELEAREILAKAIAVQPFVEFAASRLSNRDAKRVGKLSKGSIRVRFRVRGRHQAGTILEARGSNGKVALSIERGNIVYRVIEAEETLCELEAYGQWDDGNWHELVVTTGYGASTLYVDGYEVARIAGVCFFSDVDGVDRISVGQDLDGARLFGEAQTAMIYARILSDNHIKHLCGIEPLHTKALFDLGYEDAQSYRIPALLTTHRGTLIAGADQRTSIPNDSPNHINFVIRRSTDGGRTWGPLRTIVRSIGAGLKGASTTDPVLVQHRESGRIIAFFDHFPGAIGQLNAIAGTGYTPEGKRILLDSEGEQYVAGSDGAVRSASGSPTDFMLDSDGCLRDGAAQLGHVETARDELTAPPLTVMPTSYLWMVVSDDDGETWSEPIDLNPQVKEPWMPFLGASPGTGVCVENGPYSGRLVMPVYYSDTSGSSFACAALLSDDAGHTWRLGGSPNDTREWRGCDEASLYESSIVEVEGGELVVFARNQHPSGNVAVSRSTDGGETWSSVSYDPQLTEIFSQPNAVRIDMNGREAVVFANASALLPFRGCGTLRLSMDGAHTWPHNRVFNPRHYVYQSMAQLPNGNIGLLWEREWHGLFFTEIPLVWLTGSRSTRVEA